MLLELQTALVVAWAVNARQDFDETQKISQTK